MELRRVVKRVTIRSAAIRTVTDAASPTPAIRLREALFSPLRVVISSVFGPDAKSMAAHARH
jgi:hypothetical protein